MHSTISFKIEISGDDSSSGRVFCAVGIGLQLENDIFGYFGYSCNFLCIADYLEV
jgi:hypothetical protein